jgi:hypothetical protein
MNLLWITIIRFGKQTKDQIQLQMAADTAAQSACAIRARGLSSIGRLNNWLGLPIIGIGLPLQAWWPDAARPQQAFVHSIQSIQDDYNQTYGGASAYTAALHVAREQGADIIASPQKSYSLRLQRNVGPIWYLSTIHFYEVPVPNPFRPDIADESPNTKRWMEQGPDFHRKTLNVRVYRGSQRFLGKRMPPLTAVSAARVYNTRGPMFPQALGSGRFAAGIEAHRAYRAATSRWLAQLVSMRGQREP